MTAPVERKSIKVSEEMHAAVHHVAASLGGSADDALRHLVSTVRLDLTQDQRARWQVYADAAGLPLADWVVLRMEAVVNSGHLHRRTERSTT